MDRQVCGVSGNSVRVNFKYLLISFGIFLGFGILKLGAEWSAADSLMWVELEKFGIDGMRVCTVIFSGLECILFAPLLMTAAAMMYRAVNGIGAERLGGFCHADVWLRSAAVLLPFAAAANLYDNLFNDAVFMRNDITGKANELLLLTLLQSLAGCVYYGFAACDPMKKIKLGRIYRAGLKRAVSRPARLILTAVLCAAAHYLLFALLFKALNGAVLWEDRGTYYFNTKKPVLDYRIRIAVWVILDSLALFAQSLIFYIVMLRRKKAVRIVLEEKDRVV